MRLSFAPIAVLFSLAVCVVHAAEPLKIKAPLGLDPVRIPLDNPLTKEKVESGKQLFFDPRLSKDNTVSCATCHNPEKGWSNGEAFATGVRSQKGGRSASTIVNSGYQKNQFWDGRATEVEEQALGPIQNPIEMDLTLEELEVKLNKIDGYRKQFKDVFNTDVTRDSISKAIAAFERTIVAGDSPYDRFQAGDKKALSESAQRGMKLFFNKGQCSSCHSGPSFTDGGYHNLGIGTDKPNADVGRQAHSKLLGDRGSFKTPTLRDIARTAPYMHDGSIKTLEEVIEHYNRGGVANPQLDEGVYALDLSAQEKADLVTFMKDGLSSNNYPVVKAPELPK